MTVTDTGLLSAETLKKSYSYREYTELLEGLLEKGKTTGENHSEVMLHYSKMNLHRMKRQDKYAKLDPELEKRLQGLNRKLIWLVLTEGWCGDAAQNLPIINKMAEASPNIELNLILRDENLDIMDQFLTKINRRSIPKLICLDADSHEVVGTWGPRPETAADLAESHNFRSDVQDKKAKERLHKWYADDKNSEIQAEFLNLLEEWTDK